MVHFFLYLNNIPLYVWINFYSSIHQLMDIWVVSIFWCYEYRCKFSFLLGIYLGVLPVIIKLYGNFNFNIFRNFQTIFQTKGITLHFQEKCMRIPIFLHPCQQLLLSTFFIIVMLVCMIQYIIMVLICIFPMSSSNMFIDHF